MREARSTLEIGTPRYRRVTCYMAHLSIGLGDEALSHELHRQAMAYLRAAPDADEDGRCEMYLHYFKASIEPEAAASYVRSSLSRDYDQLSTFELLCLGAISARALSAVGQKEGAYELALVMQNGIRWRLTAYHAVERYLARTLLDGLSRRLLPEERSSIEAIRLPDPKRDGIGVYLKDAHGRLLRALETAFAPGSSPSNQQGSKRDDGDERAVRGEP